MSKHALSPQGDFPAAGLGRRLAAMFYDFLLCTALLIVTAFIYKLVQMAIVGEQQLRKLSDAGALDGDPLLSTILLFVLFGFFAKFWTYKGQTLGMQVWGI
uniref:RDD family protein n=2 Tax=Pseudomonas TaxID=286 RepID=UPI003F967D6B